MENTIQSIIELVKAYILWGSVILGGVIIILTELSKLTKFTKSTKDDLIVAKLLTEVKEWKDKLVGIIKK